MSLEPGSLFASLIVGGIGFVAFSYGVKQRRVPQIAAGVALMGFPYLVPSPLPMSAIAAGILGALWLAIRMGL